MEKDLTNYLKTLSITLNTCNMGTNRFEIGDEVYHVTPESDKGVIVEINYVYSSGKYLYTVATSWNQEFICSEHELTDTKKF